MGYFLAKSDPESYGLEELERDKKTVWDGVTNPQAVRAIKEMRPGDKVFIYHSGGVSSVVGISIIRSQPRDDPKKSVQTLAASPYSTSLAHRTASSEP